MVISAVQNKKISLVLKSHQKVIIVHSNQIVILTAIGTYTKIILTSEKSILMSKPLKYYEKYLDGACFFRCHKSHLVNLEFFTEYNVVRATALFSGLEVPVSRRKRHEFIEKIISFYAP